MVAWSIVYGFRCPGENEDALIPSLACASWPGAKMCCTPCPPVPCRLDENEFGVNKKTQVLQFPPLADAYLTITVFRPNAIDAAKIADMTITMNLEWAMANLLFSIPMGLLITCTWLELGRRFCCLVSQVIRDSVSWCSFDESFSWGFFRRNPERTCRWIRRVHLKMNALSQLMHSYNSRARNFSEKSECGTLNRMMLSSKCSLWQNFIIEILLGEPCLNCY